MLLQTIASAIDGTILSGQADLEVSCFYAGDFLSHVMGGAPAGCAWLTIMNNLNVAGVAVITDIKAIIICDGIKPIDALVEKCKEEKIAIIATKHNVFESAAKITRVGCGIDE